MIIYKAINLQNRKVYIGKTTSKTPSKYFESHIYHALKNKDKNTRSFYNAIRKYGKENFKWEILGYCDSKEELNEAEIECIDFYKSYDRLYGYNLTLGGDGAGYKLTEERKQKISRANKGVPTWNKGKKTGPRSEETKAKISKKNKGKIITQEMRKKISKTLTGRKNPSPTASRKTCSSSLQEKCHCPHGHRR